jgi:hypothetical protein
MSVISWLARGGENENETWHRNTGNQHLVAAAWRGGSMA